MGAGNSTAASCSSLDLANGQTSANKYRYYQRQQNRQHYLHEHKLQRYRKHSEAGQLPSYLRQASSHLDLTTSHLVRDDEDEALFASKSNHNNQNNNNTNNELHYGFSRPAGEAYNLTNADVSCPVMVLPAKARHQHDPSSPSVLHLAASGGAKKSNAGVASRILQHRQQQRSNELKKFSDSLPSLNNMSITCQQQQSRMADMKQPIGSNHLHHHHPNHHHRHHPSQIMPTFHQHAVPQLPHQHYQHHHNHQNHNHNHNNHQPRQLRDYQQHEQCRPSSQGKQQPAKLRSKDRTTGAIQAAAGQVKQQQLTTSKQKVSNAILVSPNKFMDNHPMCYNRHGQAQSSYMMNDDGNDDDDDDCDHEQTVMGQRQVFDWPSKKQQQQQRQMKRATSLSSLHNLNQSNQLHAQQDGGYGGGSGRAGRGLPFAGDGRLNCRADMIIPTPFSQSINLSNHSNAAAASNLKRCHPSDIRASPRPPSLGLRNSNELGAPVNKCRQSPLNHELRGAGGLQQAYKLPPQTPQNHRQPSSQSHQINQAIMLKKSHKYKQAANVTSGQMAAKNNRYKSKQQQQQLQQPPNGCPVLPQLPRSQSLHELIQLRATENGQRMRTTGTLRGPLNGCDQVGKVNLVAELLETRRQQRQNLDEDDKTTTAATTTATTTMLDEGQRKNSETLLSQSSSTDDGIHDVSISGDGQNSTNDSRGKQYSSSSVSSSSDNHRHHLHRSSISSQDCQDKRTATPTRQRIFKKQPATSSQANRFAAHKNSSLEKAKQDTSYEHQVEGRRSQQQQSHMSTLKRSTSYSALQDTRSRNKSSDSCDDRDGDESDDLNELARFLYQFKQRQVKTQAENLSRSREKLATQKDVVLVGINERKLSSHASGGTINHDDDNQLQQSPNSTTSTSSGFASSTCTSNHSTSFASAGSDASSSGNSGSGTKKGCMSFESSTASTTSSRELRHEDASNGRRRISSPKKYPAPPRPDQTQQRQAAETNININAKSCPLSGKLKLSSSLLSIVDEYQSTLETNNSNRLLAKNGLHATSSSNLTSVHLFGGGANLVCQQKPAPSSSGQQQQSRRVQVVGTKDNVGGGGGDQEQHDDYDELQREQFEQLRKYTKLRQMSQSELALNHLTSSTMLDIGGKEKSKHQQRNLLAQGKSSASSKNQSHSNLANENKSSSTNSGKPYTNRLFNLIRRISEKSEPAAAASHHRAAPGCDDVSATSLADGNSSSQTGGCGVGKLVVLGSHSEGCGGGGHVGGANSVGGQLFRAAPLPDESCDQRRQTDGGGLNAINQIGEMKAEHHSKAKKCGNQERRVQAPDRLANESKDESASNNSSSSNNSDSYSKLSLGGQVKGIGGCGRAGESLCDLNFDCDFELIKNCRSANELDQRQQQQHTRQAYCLAKTSCSRQDAHCKAGAGKPSSLFTNTSSSITSNNEFGERQVAGGGKKKGSAAAIEKRREKNETANKAIANPSRENSNNNNWRLAPAASLIGPVTSNSSKACSSIGDTCGRDLARLRQGGGLVSSNRQQDHAVDNYNNNNKAAGKPNGRPRDAASEEGLSGSCCGDGCARDKLTKACKHHQQQPSKSKWSASSWLLGVGSGEKKKGSASSGSKKEPKTSSANNNNNDSKRSYLARLIPNSGTPTSGSSGKSKQRDDDILGGELSSCDMISEADRLLVELDHSLDLVSDGKHLSGQRRWWQGDSNEMDNSYNDDDEEDDYDYDENDEHERKADKVRVGREENRTFSREGVCINRAQKGGGYQVAVDDDENDNDDADYASINRAMINETFDFDPEKLTGTNGLTIEPAGSPSDSFTFSAPSSPTLGEKFNSTNGISEPSVKGNDQARLCSHHLGHRPMANDNPPPNALCKQSNDCTVDDSTESKRKNSALPDLQPSCCNRSNHLVGPFKCDHQQQQGAKATQAFKNGVARKGDNCVGEMAPVDNHNGTVDNHQACVESYNSRSRHNLNGAPAPMDDELYHQDQAGVQLASRPEPLAEVSIQACRLHALNDNKIAGELNGVATNPPTATSATPKQIHPNSDKTKGAQLSSRHAGNIGAKRCAEHGHINVVDASSSNATFNVCHHHRQNAPLDGRSSSGKIVGRCCNDVAELRTTTTQANDFVPSDSCGRREQQHNHRHDTDQPSPMLCTQTKQGIANTTSGSGSKGSADYIKQLSTPELVAATATTTTTAALTSTPSGNSRDHNANRPLATTDANKKKEANCIIANEQPLAGCSLGCLDNNAGVKWNGKRAMAVRGEIKAELEEAETDDRSRRTGDHSVRSIHGQPICCPAAPSCCAQAAPLQAIGNNSQTSIGVTTPASNGGLKQQQAAKFGKIELDKTEKKNGAELEAGSQACNCKLATATTTTRANVNMAPAQKGHFPIGECACERGGSLDVIGTCLGANCSPPPVGERRNCNASCLARKECIRCDRQSEFPMEDDKLIIQKDFCHCCSTSATGLQAHDDDDGQLLRGDRGGGYLDESNNKPTAAKSAAVCSVSSTKCTTTTTSPATARNEPLETGRSPASGANGELNKEPPKVTYYHYSHKMGNFAPTTTTTNGCQSRPTQHHHSQPSTRQTDAPGLKRESHTANGGSKDANRQQPRDASCRPPPNRSHDQADCEACGLLQPEGNNNDTSKQNSSASYKSSPGCGMMTTTTTSTGHLSAAASHSSDRRYPPNEDVRNLSCSHGGAARATGMNYAPTEEDAPSIARNKKAPPPSPATKQMAASYGEHSERVPNSNATANCCGSSSSYELAKMADTSSVAVGVKRTSEFSSKPQPQTAAGRQCTQTNAECLDRLQAARKCDIVNNNRSTPTTTATTTTRHNGQMIRQSNNEPPTTASGGSQFLGQTGRCNLQAFTSSNQHHLDCSGSADKRAGGSVLFGKLRNSLLNQRPVCSGSSGSSSDAKHPLASCQENYYAGPGVQSAIQSILLPVGAGKHTSSHKLSATTNDFDENFILKRKTPNAGLKSRC